MSRTKLHGALLMLLAAPAAGGAALDEVVVTATRAPAALMTHPGSITRIDAATVVLVAPTHSSELLNRAAGALLQRGSGQESLTALRSPVLTGAGACGAVLVLEDGVPIRPVGTCNVNELFELNVEQAAAVEVLRGPGSALYGSSAVHGIINVIPPSPAELPALALALETGSDAWLRAKFAAGGSLGGGHAGLYAHASSDGGWRDASGFDEQKIGAVWTGAAGDGTLTLRLSLTRLDQDTAGFVTGLDAWRDPRIARSNPNPGAYRDARSARLLAHYAAGRFDLRAVLRSSRMDFLQHFLLGQPVEDNGQDSAAVLAGWMFPDVAGGELRVGLDAEIADSRLLQRQDGPTTGGSPAANAIRPAGRHYDYAVDSALLAGYAEWRRPLAEAWTLEAGLRAEQVRYDYDNRMLAGNTDENGLPCPGGCLYSRPADRSDRFTNVAPRAALLWRPSEGVAAWLSLARGFRAPELTELYRLQRQQQVADLGSERIDAAELGLRLRRGPVAADLAAFAMHKRDVILRDSAGFNLSGGRTRHVGLEYQLDARLSERWSLSGTGTLARHEYRFTAAVEQGEQVTAGNDVDTAPRRLHALRLRRADDDWSAELEWLQVGPYFTNAANTIRYGGHGLWNLRLAWQPAPAWTLSLRATNLLDRAYADRADFAFGSHRYFPGRGRAAFVEVGWRRLQSAAD